jgi:hypothetical protein
MINKLMVALMMCASLVAPSAFAQTATSEAQMPAVKEAPAEAGQSGLLSGEKPFTLMVDENVGELIYQFDEQTKELESINAKRGVIFASEDMTLNADEMEYKTLNSSLVATGKRVVVRMGDMIVTCQLFKYNPETQEGQFEGHPIVYQRNKDGKVTETAGRVISIVNVNGKFQMRVGSGGGISTYVRSTGVSPETGTLEKKTLAPGQKGASMIINNNPSPLAAPSAGSTSTNSSAGGILPSPDIDTDSAPRAPAAQPAGSSVGKIDPNNPSDVQKFTDKKSE